MAPHPATESIAPIDINQTPLHPIINQPTPQSTSRKLRPPGTAELSAHRRSRLCNLTVCLVHSVLAGAGAVVAFAHYGRIMVDDLIVFHTMPLYHLATMSTGYFLHDSLDMLRHEPVSAIIELLGHHALTAFTFLCAIASHVFLPFVAMALGMEVHSIVLHIRTIGLLSGSLQRHSNAYTVLKWLNMFSLVVFRLALQTYMVYTQYTFHYQMHWMERDWLPMTLVYLTQTYQIIAEVGLLLFHIVNFFLLWRVLKADGWLSANSGATAESPPIDITHMREPKGGKKKIEKDQPSVRLRRQNSDSDCGDKMNA